MKRKSIRTESYKEWLEEQQKIAAEANQARAALASESARADVGYGQTAESLGQASVTDSGYAARLSERLNEQRSAAASDIAEKTASEQAESERAYLDRVTAAREKVKSALVSRHATDYASAYRYAIYNGLEKQEAKKVANEAILEVQDTDYTATSSTTRMQVLNRIISYQLGYDAAYRYALACGLNRTDAEAVARAANDVNQARTHLLQYTDFYNA